MYTKPHPGTGSKRSSDSPRHPWAQMKKQTDMSHPRDNVVFRDPISRHLIEPVERYLERGGAIKVCPALHSVAHETASLGDSRVACEIVQGKIQMVVGF